MVFDIHLEHLPLVHALTHLYVPCPHSRPHSPVCTCPSPPPSPTSKAERCGCGDMADLHYNRAALHAFSQDFEAALRVREGGQSSSSASWMKGGRAGAAGTQGLGKRHRHSRASSCTCACASCCSCLVQSPHLSVTMAFPTGGSPSAAAHLATNAFRREQHAAATLPAPCPALPPSPYTLPCRLHALPITGPDLLRVAALLPHHAWCPVCPVCPVCPMTPPHLPVTPPHLQPQC